MGYPTYPFVDLKGNPFKKLSSSPQIILETTANAIQINSIIITNTSDSDIRINIIRQTNIASPISIVETFLAYNFLIPSFRTADHTTNYYNTMDLVEKLGLKEIVLQYSSTVNEKLLCYSNGATQYFDCNVPYTIFNEIPPS